MSPPPERRFNRSQRMMVVVFILSLPFINPYLRGDGNGYYAYVRSAVIDGDLQFENEFRRADPAFQPAVFDVNGNVRPKARTRTGHVWNQWAVGPALVWLPAFLVAHGIAHASRAFGFAITTDGYSAPYLWACAATTATCGFGALLLGMRSAERIASTWSATTAAAGVWLASPLPVYMYFLPFHVHAIAALSTALFCWYWLRTIENRTGWQWLAWGLLGGFMGTVYQLQTVLWIIALVELLRVRGARARLVAAVAFGAGAVAALSPHFAVKWVLFGSPIITGYQDTFSFFTPRLWQVGFASDHGMFAWTPLLLACVAGLVWLWRRDRRIAGPALAAFVVFYYVVASYQNWHGLSAFGGRFFLSLTLLFVIGLAVALDALMPQTPPHRSPKIRRWACVAVLAVLTVWNAGLMFQWGTDVISNRGPVDFRQVAVNQVTVVPQRLGGFVIRYLTDRRRLTDDVERQDLADQAYPRR